MRQPLVSVIIPAYNAARFLGSAVSSALVQTYPRLEVVIVDDGSTDATGGIADSYGDGVVVVHQPNGGLAAARNAGILAASGEVITLCDADDHLLPRHVERHVESLLSSGGKTWVASPVWLLSDEGVKRPRLPFYMGRPQGDEQLDAFLAGNFVPIFASFTRAMYDEVGGFDKEFSCCEDWDFWLRSAMAGWRVVLGDEPTGLYRLSAGSLSSNVDAMVRGHRAVLTKALSSGYEWTLEQRTALEDRIASGPNFTVVQRARAALRRLELSEARGLFAEASNTNPWDIDLRRKALLLRACRPLTAAAPVLTALRPCFRWPIPEDQSAGPAGDQGRTIRGEAALMSRSHSLPDPANSSLRGSRSRGAGAKVAKFVQDNHRPPNSLRGSSWLRRR
jgi:glycosyltransferase involved in cell wall biosynthesis